MVLSPRNARARRALLPVVAATLILGIGTPASAHAILLSANPSPNIGLGKPPTVARLRLSEPLRLPPSTIKVLDRNGTDMATSVRLIPTDHQSMEATLRPLSRGTYRVEWRSVSVLDGHTIRGSYFFGVGEPPPGAPEEIQNGPLTGFGFLGIAFRIVQDAALLLAVGLAGLTLISRRETPRFEAAALARVGAVALVAGVATIATVTEEAVAAAGWSIHGIVDFLGGSVAGWGRVVSIAAALGALVAARGRWPAATLAFACAALAAIGVSGHAGATRHPLPFMAANAAHLVAVGLWLGGAAAIATVWRKVAPDRNEILALIGRASPIAIASAILVAGTGAVNALGQLSSPADLVRTGYGAVVSAKIAVLIAAVFLGARHSFFLRPRLAAASPNPGGAQVSRGIRRALLGEGWVAAAAVIFAAILVAFPNPPAQEARAERQSSTVPSIYAVGDAPFVTVADHDGPLLISLTVAPPAPGKVVLAVQLINSLETPTDGWRVAVSSTSPGGETQTAVLKPCGPGCFAGRAVLPTRGMWSFAVDAKGARASFRIPLPTPDGSPIFSRLRHAWDALRSVEIDERFSNGAGFLVNTRYLYEAPDRSAVQSSGGREEIDVGTRSFTRDASTRPWMEGDNPFPPHVPFPFFWSTATKEPRLLDDTVVGGRPAYTLAIFDPFGIWFRVVIDKETMRPLEDHMRAIGHFMDRTYSRVDEPLGIRAPV